MAKQIAAVGYRRQIYQRIEVSSIHRQGGHVSGCNSGGASKPANAVAQGISRYTDFTQALGFLTQANSQFDMFALID